MNAHKNPSFVIPKKLDGNHYCLKVFVKKKEHRSDGTLIVHYQLEGDDETFICPLDNLEAELIRRIKDENIPPCSDDHCPYHLGIKFIEPIMNVKTIGNAFMISLSEGKDDDVDRGMRGCQDCHEVYQAKERVVIDIKIGAERPPNFRIKEVCRSCADKLHDDRLVKVTWDAHGNAIYLNT